MTAHKPVDLDALMRLHAKTVQGEWTSCRACKERPNGCMLVWAPDGNHTIFQSGDGEEVPRTGTTADAAFVVAAHNELPAIVAEMRALREVAEAARASLPLCQREVRFSDGFLLCDEPATYISREFGRLCDAHADGVTKTPHKHATRAAALVAALAKVPR